MSDFSPMYKGDTQTPFTPHITYTDGTDFNLSGATISMKMLSVSNPETSKTCTGTWTIINAASGTASYAWESTDVDTPGSWYLYLTFTFSTKTVHTDPLLLEILTVP